LIDVLHRCSISDEGETFVHPVHIESQCLGLRLGVS
jgi:hypothetical protein